MTLGSTAGSLVPRRPALEQHPELLGHPHGTEIVVNEGARDLGRRDERVSVAPADSLSSSAASALPHLLDEHDAGPRHGPEPRRRVEALAEPQRRAERRADLTRDTVDPLRLPRVERRAQSDGEGVSRGVGELVEPVFFSLGFFFEFFLTKKMKKPKLKKKKAYLVLLTTPNSSISCGRGIIASL